MINKSDGEGGKHRSNRIIVMHSEHIPSYEKGMKVHVCISSLCVSKMDHIASHCGNTRLQRGRRPSDLLFKAFLAVPRMETALEEQEA